MDNVLSDSFVTYLTIFDSLEYFLRLKVGHYPHDTLEYRQIFAMYDVPFVSVLPKIKALMHAVSVHLPVRQDNGAPDKVFLQLPHIHSGAGAKVGEVAGAGAEVGEV